MIDTDRIKDAIDLVAWIGHSVPLRRAGKQWVGICPFHKERTPSFSVHPEKRVWHCRGCRVGGDIFAFVQRLEGISFMQAARMLADYAGIDLGTSTPGQREEYARLREERKRAAAWRDIRVEEVAQMRDDHLKLYHLALQEIRRSGLTEELLEEYELGKKYRAIDTALDSLRGATGDAILSVYRSKIDAG